MRGMRRNRSRGELLELEAPDIPGEPRDPRGRAAAAAGVARSREDRSLMGAHVIPWYRAEDKATREALDVQACKRCGAVLWRRETTKDNPKYPPAALVGDDCPGEEDESSMAKKAATGRTKKPRPEQVELPGTEDSAIAPLEKSAKRYAGIRDERMELNREEAALKSSLISLMHKHGKTEYRRHGIEIKLVPEAENVKVKIKGKGDDDDEEGGAE